MGRRDLTAGHESSATARAEIGCQFISPAAARAKVSSRILQGVFPYHTQILQQTMGHEGKAYYTLQPRQYPVVGQLVFVLV